MTQPLLRETLVLDLPPRLPRARRAPGEPETVATDPRRPDIDLAPGIRYRLDHEHCIVETRGSRWSVLRGRYARFESCAGELHLRDDHSPGGFVVGIGPGTTAHLRVAGMGGRTADVVRVTAELTAAGFTARRVQLAVRLVEVAAQHAVLHARGRMIALPAPVRARHSDPVTRLMTSSGVRLEIAARFVR